MERTLHNIWTIFSNEFRLYFISPIVYFIAAGWFIFFSLFFTLGFASMGQFGGEPSMSSALGTMSFLLLFIAPALTMRLISEEIQSGTHELLMTSPVQDWEVVTAKWLASWAVMTVFLLVSGIYPAFLMSRGNPDPGLIWTGFLGLWLMCGTMLAVGTFTSSINQYQVVAYIAGFGLLVVLWIANIPNNFLPANAFTAILDEVALRPHQDNMITRGLIDAVDVTYFIAMIVGFLFLATQVLGSRRYSA
jgi:ABC-2 type transport system permease protein